MLLMIYYLILFLSLISCFISMYLMNNSLFITMDIPLLVLFSMNLSFTTIMDWYSMMFSTTVMIISSMILVFSLKYIPKKEFKQFSLIMLSFVTSMLILIMSDNIMFMLLGWDGLGLSSFMLVIYYQNFSSSASGSITILSNRLGDVAILILISMLTMKMNWNFFMNEEFPKMVMFLLIIAAISKSAQFPFSSWLPAAMAAPTPISALVHSSTLVTAGVYLLIRVMNFPHPNSMLILMMISTATTIYASMTANWEQDMKKIIALSTLSQIGMMMFAISMGAIKIAFFHLIVHAMFKSMMFLCAGMMIHGFAYQDMRSMSLMKNSSPMMFMIMTISNMTLMGLPFMSGFFSKDSIIEFMMNYSLASLLSVIMTISIGMTASYSIRMLKISSKSIFKNKSDNEFSNNLYMEIPMMMMVPFSLFMGASLMWLIMPLQMFFMPTLTKLSIVMMLIMGMLLGFNMKFMSKSFLKMGLISNSLWFLNHLSTQPSNPLFSFMMNPQKNDKSWQEVYGPQNSYLMIKGKDINPELNLNYPSLILMITLMIPLIILM